MACCKLPMYHVEVRPQELIAFLTGREVDDDLRRRIGEQMDAADSSVSRTMREVGDRSEMVLTSADCWKLLRERCGG